MFEVTFEDELHRQWSSEFIFYNVEDAKEYLLDKGFIEKNRIFERKHYNWSVFLKAYISPKKIYDNKQGELTKSIKLRDLESLKEMTDLIQECYWDLFRGEPEKQVILDISLELPESIAATANQWGWNDTVVRDNVYSWIKENIHPTK